MPLIDTQGRVAGRWNIIDAAVVVLVLLMIPVGYGAYVLFRKPDPVITSISPTSVPEKSPPLVTLTGKDLRAFLRVRVGSADATMLHESPTRAFVRLPLGLPPGTHDVALFDEGRELARLPAALTMVPTPPPAVPPPPPPVPPPPGEAQVQAVGAFLSLPPAEARRLRANMTLSRPGAQNEFDRTIARILTTRPPEPATLPVVVGPNDIVMAKMTSAVRVPAILRIRCIAVGDRCKIGDQTVEQPATLTLILAADTPGQAATIVSFRIDEVRAPDRALVFPPRAAADATIRVQLLVPAGIIDQLKVGDVDRHGGAVLMSLGSQRKATAATQDVGGVRVPTEVLSVEATFRMPAMLIANAWQYAGRPLRAGEVFVFETLRYSMSGSIADVKLPDTSDK